MSPDTRSSLVEQFQALATQATAAAKAVKAMDLDDPLADEKIKSQACQLSTAACDLSCMASKAVRMDEVADEPSGPVRVTVQAGGYPY